MPAHNGASVSRSFPVAARRGRERGFAGSGWAVGRASVSAGNASKGPEHGLPAKLTEDLTPAQTHYVFCRFRGAAGHDAFMFSFFACAAERTALWVWFGHHQFNLRVEARFDLGCGAIDYVSSKAESAIPLQLGMVPLKRGWWWCWMSAEFDGFEATESLSGEDDAGAMGALIGLADAAGSMGYDGDGSSGLWLAGPRIERAFPQDHEADAADGEPTPA